MTDPAEAALRMRARSAVAVADLFLPAEGRWRDDDRATIARLLAALVESVERDLRDRLTAMLGDRPLLADALASSRIAIARPILDRAGALRDPALVTALGRRAEEARLAVRLHRARDRAAEIEPVPDLAPTAMLSADQTPAVAAAARALALAGQAGRDGSGAAIAGKAELSAEAQHRLVWRIAAALRDYAIAHHGLAGAQIDPLIARAAGESLAGYDEADTLAARAIALARALAQAGRLDGSLAGHALAAGEVMLAAATLAVRGGIGIDAAWDMMLDHDPGRLLLLCRAADIAPDVAADIALRLATGMDDEALADRLEGYDSLAPQGAAAAIALWRLDPTYLDAIAELAGRPGA